jgi:tocopherol O-methyltransferase
VRDYYDAATGGFYLEGWDAQHIHLGVFDGRRTSRYRRQPTRVLVDRTAAVQRMTRLIVESARISRRDLVVDAGCGVGGTSLYVAERYGCSVVGLNINDQQLGIARRRAVERGLANRVTFRICDCARELPFPDDSVDAIVNIESACHYRDRATFIAECARVLRPGGRLAAQDWMASEHLGPARRSRQIAPLEAAWVLWKLDSLSSYRTMLEAAGLRVTTAESIGDRVLPNGYFMRLCYDLLLSSSIRGPLTAVERANMERFRTFSEAMLGGFLTIGRYVAVKPWSRRRANHQARTQERS